MISLYPLVMNESIKIIKKRRFHVIIAILLILIPIFTYAQMRVAQTIQANTGTTDWKADLRQKINDDTRSLNSNRGPEEWKRWRQVQIQINQYYLDHNVDPKTPNGVTFTREFVKNASSLFIPLLVIVIAADLVSSEHTQGTIKLLLTRPVSRWKVLMSKLITLILFVSLIVLATGVLSYLISGLIFGYGGWTLPIFVGFQVVGTSVDLTDVKAVGQWLYLFMEFGLVWFVALVVGVMSLLISVLVRNAAVSMGVMLALIIMGQILKNMVSSWESAKYLFNVNLELTSYLSGSLPPIAGMSLGFSLAVLSIWGLASLVVSFLVFSRKDILN